MTPDISLLVLYQYIYISLSFILYQLEVLRSKSTGYYRVTARSLAYIYAEAPTNTITGELSLSLIRWMARCCWRDYLKHLRFRFGQLPCRFAAILQMDAWAATWFRRKAKRRHRTAQCRAAKCRHARAGACSLYRHFIISLWLTRAIFWLFGRWWCAALLIWYISGHFKNKPMIVALLRQTTFLSIYIPLFDMPDTPSQNTAAAGFRLV